MRLIDKIALAPAQLTGVDGRGRPLTLPGAGSYAEDLRSCRTRYVLDRRASRQCADIFMGGGDKPLLDDDILKLPPGQFWMELYADGDEEQLSGTASGLRLGYLVDMEPRGRKGLVVRFAETPAGAAVLLSGTVRFDLDEGLIGAPKTAHSLRMWHAERAVLNDLLTHARLEFSPDWMNFAKTLQTPYSEIVAEQAAGAWSALPVILGFTALLNSRSILRQRASDLDRLNNARIKRGRAPLLDHIEITLNLAAAVVGAAANHNGDGTTRRTPRLHLVRGHQVHRGTKVFWRSSHYRGAVDHGPVTTVNVKWQAPTRPNSARHG